VTRGFGAIVVTLLLGVGSQQAQIDHAPYDLVGRSVSATVISVVDGDTVHVLVPPRRDIRVRLEGIDTPEKGEPFSQQATKFTRAMMFSRTVQVNGRDVDRYGRLVARISIDGKDASTELATAGLACYYRRYRTDPSIERAERDARAARKGFWSSNAQLPNCVSQESILEHASNAQPQIDSFIGNVASHVYHLSSCRNAHCKNCTRVFNSEDDAKAAGYRRAGDCIGRRRR
jgi:endonuclease YncB( thermonuclease family)